MSVFFHFYKGCKYKQISRICKVEFAICGTVFKILLFIFVDETFYLYVYYFINLVMKRLTLSIVIAFLSMSLFAHPGHEHSGMTEGKLMVHLLWILVPLFVGVVVWFSRKRKKALK
jgi:hypothetical protein